MIRPQTDFPSRTPHSQKIRESKGFCEDNLPLQMAEQNSQGGAEPIMLSIPTCAPPRQVCYSCLLIKSDADRCSYMRPRQPKSSHHFQHKSPPLLLGSKSGGYSFSQIIQRINLSDMLHNLLGKIFTDLCKSCILQRF